MLAPSARREAHANRASRRLAPLLILLLLTLLGYWLRVHALDAYSFWTDEGLTPVRSGYPMAQILRNEIVIQGVVTHDTHPPLYYLIIHVTRQLFGLSDFAFRYPSVLFGVLLIPLLYQLGRRLVPSPSRRGVLPPRPVGEGLAPSPRGGGMGRGSATRSPAGGGMGRGPATPSPSGRGLGRGSATSQTQNPLPNPPPRGEGAGLIVALLAAVNPLYVYYSQEARMYTLLALLVTAMSYVLWRALTDHRQQATDNSQWTRRGQWSVVRRLVLYAVLAGLAVYTHYTAVFVVAVQALLWAWLLWRAGLRRVIAGGLVVAVLLAIPLVPYTLPRLSSGAEANYYPVSPLTMLQDVVRFYHLGLTVDFTQPLVRALTWLALGLVILGAWAIGRPLPMGDEARTLSPRAWGEDPLPKGTGTLRRLFLLSWLLAPVLGLMLGSALFKPMYQGVRHIMAGSPAFLLLLAAGIWALWQWLPARWRAAAPEEADELTGWAAWVAGAPRFNPIAIVPLVFLLLGAAVALLNLYTDPAYAKDDFRAIVRFIETRAGGRDAVVYNNAVLLPLHEHYRQRPDVAVTALPAYPQFATGQEPELAALAAEYDRLWFITDPPADGRDDDGLIHGWLDDNLLEVSDRRFPARTTEARVIGYGTEVSDQWSAVSGQWSGFPSLQGVRVDRSPLALPTLWVDLWWAGDAPPAEAQLVFTLTGPDGAEHYRRAHAVLRQMEFDWNPAAPNQLSYDLPLPPGLPPGAYALAAGPEGQAAVPLSEVEIAPTTQWPAAPEALFADSELAPLAGRSAFSLQPSAFGLELAAVEPWDDHVLAGNNLPLTLFWRAGPAGIDLTNARYRLEVIDRRGDVLRSQEARPGAPWLGQVAGGALLREVTSLYFRPETPPGRYRLRWTLLDGETVVGRPVVMGEIAVEEEAQAKTQSKEFPLLLAGFASLRETPSPETKRRRRLLGLILAAYLAITLAYGAINPLFEAPDEHWHFFTAESIARTGRLPRVEEPPDDFLGQEAAQPPLYYLLGAALIAPIDTSGARDAIWLNPFAWIGDASALNNVNRMVHPPDETWPWTGHVLAAHLLRGLSTLLGLGTLLAVYGSARRLWPESHTRVLIAPALVAFLPQFTFIHASITNDALITFLCSVALYQLIGLWQEGQELTPRTPSKQRAQSEESISRPLPPSRPWRELLLGLTIGLAALSKNAGVLLLVYALGFLVALAWRGGQWRALPGTLLRVALPVLLLAGPLWARNYALYGDPMATAPFIAIAGGDRDYSLAQVLGESKGLLLSLVGVFGWFNLRPPQWVYGVWLGIVGLAVVGVMACWLRRLGRRPPAVDHRQRATVDSTPPAGRRLSSFILQPSTLLAVWPLMVYAGLLAFMMRTEAAQGRLLFPAVLPVALGLAWGLRGWGSCMPHWLGSINRRLSPLVALAALATTVYCLVFVIRPTYQPPPLVAGVPAEVGRVLPPLAPRGQGLSLLAAQVETETARPGDVVWLTLYWRADEAPSEPPELVLEVFGRQVDRIANLHSYHGRGLFPATLWPPGAIVADRFAVRIDADAAAPVLARVFARVAGGEPGIEVAAINVVPQQSPPVPDSWQALIGDHIALAAAQIVPSQARPGQVVRVDVRWYVPRGRPQRDYTTLIHLGQPDQPPLSTGDSPPLGGDYPTRAWRNGEVIDDDYRLVIPSDLTPGRYPIWIGMYDPASGERLPVTVEGERQPNGVYLAGWVEVACAAGDADCAP